MKSFIIVISLSLFILLYIYYFNFKTISGYVYDYDSGQPVTNAIVKYCSDSKSQCWNSADDTSITDNSGFYTVKTTDIPVIGPDVCIIIAKKGYISFIDSLNSSSRELSIYLKRK